MLQTINTFRKRFAAFIAPEIESERRTLRRDRRDALRMARRDELTGLANRRAFEMAKTRAEISAGLSFVVFDINNFKAVNDSFGHSEGDKVLCEFADVLKLEAAALGFAERTFRTGGDEFAAIVPNALAQEFRDAVERSFGALSVGSVVVSASGAIGATFEMADGWLHERKAARKGGISYR